MRDELFLYDSFCCMLICLYVEQLEGRQIILMNTQDLTSKMHQFGINIRYLGMVRSRLEKTNVR